MSADRARLLAVATASVGSCEVGKTNNSPAVRRYLATVGLPGGYEWCSAWCVWCYRAAGLGRFVPGYVNGAARSWFVLAHTIYQGSALLRAAVPRPGDLLGYRPGGRINHVGLLGSEWSEKPFVDALEGNYGGCVRRVLRPKATVYAVASYLP